MFLRGIYIPNVHKIYCFGAYAQTLHDGVKLGMEKLYAKFYPTGTSTLKGKNLKTAP